MYKEINDSEVLYMINDSDDSLELMLERYKPIINKICYKYEKIGKKVGYELEDLVQISNISLINAIKYYKDNRNTLFYTFAINCIENNIRTSLRAQQTDKQMILNKSLSIDQVIPGTDVTLLDLIEDKNIFDPIDYLIFEEKQEKYKNFINNLPFEIAVVYEMKNEGFTTSEIADLMKMDKMTIYNAFKYARNKMCLE